MSRPPIPSEISAGKMRAPTLRVDVEVAEEIPPIPAGAYGAAWVLVRAFSEPVGRCILSVPPDGVSARGLLQVIEGALGGVLAGRAEACGGRWDAQDTRSPLRCGGTVPFLESRQRVLEDAPEITVVVCTHERAEVLRRCLRGLMCLAYPRYSVLVVDSAPRSESTRRVVEEFEGDQVPVSYIREPQPGLSRARNRGARECSSGIVAWIDDDEVADRHWLAELARGFGAGPRVGVVSGLMLPADLTTWAAVRFEQYGGHSKLRGFEPVMFPGGAAMSRSPFYPLPAFATGGNAAVSMEALGSVGGVDETLGAGTLSLGGADTRLFTEVLCRGWAITYQPSALTYHYHRATMSALRRLMYAYGAGLSAYYAALLFAHPGRVRPLIALAPEVYKDAFGRGSRRGSGLPEGFPGRLKWANRLGIASGPARYLGARVVERIRR